MKFDADLTTIDSGVWREFDGSQLLIAHISNMKFQRALARLQQPHRRKYESGTMDPQANKDILCQAMAEGVLIGWSGVSSVSGDDTPYSVKAAFTALSKNPDLRDFVSDFALNLANYREAEVVELGNG